MADIYEPTDLIDVDNCIPDQSLAAIVRRSMVNANLVHEKGAIIVGTGDTTFYKDKLGNEYNIAKIAAIPPPPGDRYTIISDDSEDTGWKFEPISSLISSGYTIPFLNSAWQTTPVNSYSSGLFYITFLTSSTGFLNNKLLVQIMMKDTILSAGGVYNETGHRIVNGDIEVSDTGNITIFSNIKFDGQIVVTRGG